MHNVKISTFQFAIVVSLFTIGTTILVIPSGLAANVKQDAWIAAILGVGMNLIVVCFYNVVAKRFPDMTILEYNERLLGRWLGKFVSLFFVFFSFVGATTVLFYMGNFIKTQVMPETPIQAINIFFASVVVMGLRLGLETLARTAEIFFPWVVLLFVVLMACLMPEIQLHKLQPILISGAIPLLKAALTVAGTASLPFLVLYMVYPAHVNNVRRARIAYHVAALFGGLFFVIITFLSISVLGAGTTERHLYPSYVLAKQINIGNFLERVEILIAGIWFITVYFKTTFYFYGFAAGVAHVLGVKDYRSLLLPLGMITVVYSLIVYPNTAYMIDFDSTVYVPYALSFTIGLPLILLVAAAVSRMKGGRQ